MNLDDKHGENCFKETVIAAIPSTEPDSPLNSHSCINANNAFHLSPSFTGFAVLNCTMATETKKEEEKKEDLIFYPTFFPYHFCQGIAVHLRNQIAGSGALKLEKKAKARA